MFVPVVDRDQKPLMPTTPARARNYVPPIRRDLGIEAERIQSALLTARTSRFELVLEWIDRWAIHAYILMALGGVVLGCLGVFR